MGSCRIRANSTRSYKLFFDYEIIGPVLELEKGCLSVDVEKELVYVILAFGVPSG